MSTVSTDTYDTIGIREELGDIIYDVSPTTTPFVSNCARESVDNTFYEWQTDSLAAVNTNVAIEGEDATFGVASPTTRVGNRTEIIEDTAIMSGTVEAIDQAGVESKMAYEVIKIGKQNKRNMEHHVVGISQISVAGSNAVGRKTASYASWISDNANYASGSSIPTGDGSDVSDEAGTPRAFTEALLGAVIDSAWTNGGEPDIIMCGSFQKRKLSAFTGNSTVTNLESSAKHIINAVSMYESDYGTMSIVPNRFCAADQVLVYQKDMWCLAVLREMHSFDIAKVGDSERKQVLVEYGLKSKNQEASGIVAELTVA